MRIQTVVTLTAAIVGAIIVGAGTLGVIMHANASTVIHTAALASGCPRKDIRLVKRHEGLGAGWYQVDVCGAATRYMRTGAAFHLPGQRPNPGPGVPTEQPVASASLTGSGEPCFPSPDPAASAPTSDIPSSPRSTPLR